MSNVITSSYPFIGYVESVADGVARVRVGPRATDIVEAYDPNFGGGEAGFYCNLKHGTAVLCQRALTSTRQSTFITSILPTEALRVSGQDLPGDAPSGFTPYPTVRDGDVRIVDDGGSELCLRHSCASLSNAVGGGVSVHRDGEQSSVQLVGEHHSYATAGGVTRSGPVLRISPQTRGLRPSGTSCNNLGFDSRYLEDLDSVGFFIGSDTSHTSSKLAPRNIALSEYRQVINEFCSDYGFLGLDIEKSQATSEAAIYADSAAMGMISRTAEPGNALLLAPHELIEVMAGNVVDTFGRLYDINFRPVIYGTARTEVPTGNDSARTFERSQRASRRGLGYHFQLSTNINSSDNPDVEANFSFGLDKEGVMKLNVPMSSNTGNVPFVSGTKFYNDAGLIESRFASNVPREENVPITLRNSKGARKLPRMGTTGEAGFKRETGVRYTNNNDYFPGSSGFIRVNHTKHHNMCAAAEKLISNTVHSIVIPDANNKCGFVYGNITVDGAFERDFSHVDLAGSKNPEILHMTYVEVEPGLPAMDPGGGSTCILAGKKRSASTDGKNRPFTNSFKIDENSQATPVDDSGNERSPAGGKSANINFEGAIDVSIGADNKDGKSFVLDTAGSLIAWFGRDANNRSMVVQTDGDMLINVGGGWKEDGITMNKGRFDLRVNVTDLGYVGDGKDATSYGNDGDYLISISEAGIVIAGCVQGAPMVIRNAADIVIESGSKIIMSAPVVRKRVGGKPENDMNADPKSSDTSEASIPGVLDKMECIAGILDTLSTSLSSTEDE